MLLDSGKNNSQDRKEPFGLMGLDIAEEDFLEQDSESKLTKKSGFSKKILLFILVIILSLAAIFVWFWIFEIVGLMSNESPIIENKIQTTPITIPPPAPAQEPETLSKLTIPEATPAEIPVNASAEIPVEAPIETPKEKPLEAPKEKPVEALVVKPVQGYTIQILGLSNQKKAKQFIAEKPEKNKLHFYETQYQKKPWFIVVYGEYKTQQEAKEALLKLPSSLKQYHPWVRKRADIQDTNLEKT